MPDINNAERQAINDFEFGTTGALHTLFAWETSMSILLCRLFLLAIGSMPLGAGAADLATVVSLRDRGAETYYVEAGFLGGVADEFMVDTGSGYLVINEVTLAALKQHRQASYVRTVSGIMANGAQMTVPVYRVDGFRVGCCCVVQNIEAAVFPGTRRQILGLSALKKLAPFALSVEPAHLTLSNCEAQSADTDELASDPAAALAANR